MYIITINNNSTLCNKGEKLRLIPANISDHPRESSTFLPSYI